MSDILHAPTKKDLPTAEYVRSVLAYDPETGALRWLTPGRGRNPDLVAGCKNTMGYLVTNIKNVVYLNHRLAWLITHGTWPTGHIDHINGIRSDNRIVNLRSGSRYQNMQNLRKANKTNLSGLLGAHKYRTYYRSRITVNGEIRELGYFKTAEEAHAVYLEAKRRLHSTCMI